MACFSSSSGWSNVVRRPIHEFKDLAAALLEGDPSDSTSLSEGNSSGLSGISKKDNNFKKKNERTSSSSSINSRPSAAPSVSSVANLNEEKWFFEDDENSTRVFYLMDMMQTTIKYVLVQFEILVVHLMVSVYVHQCFKPTALQQRWQKVGN